MIKKVLFFLLVSLQFVLYNNICSAWDAKDYVTYFGTTDKEVTVGWDTVPDADFYKVVLFHVERKEVVPVALGNTENIQITFKLPRSGHFVVKVCACDKISTTSESCSNWSESTDSNVAIVGGIPRAW